MEVFLIHTCPDREWYVRAFLVPSLLEQGAKPESIRIWTDSDRLGNLFACIKSFEEIQDEQGGTWHLQDDIVICHDFVERVREYERKGDDIVQGFCCERFGPSPAYNGHVPVIFVWCGFPCIRIPNAFIKEFLSWFWEEAFYADEYEDAIRLKRDDDRLFRDWLVKHHRGLYVYNTRPNLVDHVDFLLGGSLANSHREYVARAEFFEDQYLVDSLADKLATRASNAD